MRVVAAGLCDGGDGSGGSSRTGSVSYTHLDVYKRQVIWVTDAVATMVGARGFGLHVSFPVAMLLLTAMGLGLSLIHI